jgi:8-oxo-dGTP pyrophosphatase MutT (NUDIX family)/adenylate kinase family enzyme
VHSRIHITGASGAGTTALGRVLAERLQVDHLDTDEYFWQPTNPPYQKSRPRDERLRLLATALDTAGNWVLSGSLAGWGDPIKERFDLVIFLCAPTAVRLDRLRRREVERHGPEALAPGGAMHASHVEFLAWASRYDSGDESMRSLRLHEQWLAGLGCTVIRLDAERPLADLVDAAFASTYGGMRVPPIENRAGTVFHGILDVHEDDLVHPLADGPLTHALVVAAQERRFLLLFNRFKQHWEVPGGIIEQGETPRACAARELAEETGQAAEKLDYRGVMRFSFPSGRIELGALYRGRITEVRPFTPNDEAERIVFWDRREDIGYVNEIDAALLDYG